jgi:hypothetical protein
MHHKISHLPYSFSWTLLTILDVFTSHKFKRKPQSQSFLSIESGIKGWDLIDYKELYASAQEYLGEDKVGKVTIDRSKNYVKQVKQAVLKHRPTHYIYDARTGNQNWFIGLIQSFKLAVYFQWNGIVPICILTDLPIRTWRTQCAVVSAKRGVVVSLMSPKDVFPLFPHRRLIGPLLMPFSKKTAEYLEQRAFHKTVLEKPKIIFTGSLYEPRTTILNEIAHELKKEGIELLLKARELGSERFSDEEYWDSLINTTMVITTASQMYDKSRDWTHIDHLIYRYIEVCAAGSLLVAPMVPSLERYLKPDEHFICFNGVEEAIQKIKYYFENPTEAESIAKAGNQRIRHIIESRSYWIAIDTMLGKYSLL